MQSKRTDIVTCGQNFGMPHKKITILRMYNHHKLFHFVLYWLPVDTNTVQASEL